MTNDRNAAAPSDRRLKRAPDDGLWVDLRRLTPARIGLKRSGASLATEPLLDLQLAHARARDAVHEPLDEPRLIGALTGLGLSGSFGRKRLQRSARLFDASGPRPPPRAEC
ncbi:MAG: ethanolamine ammonia-lyase light chain EutC [Pseudolabrys sp.]